jgi:hypothetical protein
MESIEEIAERFMVSEPQLERIMKDPAFRRLMAEELVKVDMEPVVINDSPTKSGYYFTQDQLTAAVLKEREECAKVCDEGYFENGARQSLRALGWSDAADTIRSRTERTE